MKKSGRSKSKSFIEEMSKELCSLLVIGLAYLSYVVELRVAIQNIYGIYAVGFVDSLVFSTTLFIVIAFILSHLKYSKF